MEWDSINSIPSFLLTGLSRSGETTSYEYDINGRRTKKVANGVTTEYYYSGEQYTGMHTSDGKDVGAILDASGGLYGIYYDDSTIGTDVGQTYYFVYNGQGDVIGLYNHGGKLIATYAYDAWGRCIEAKAVTADDDGHAVTDPDHIAFINPFRYRGYYYDAESGLYYLNSRYYDPETGRFLNADGIIGSGGIIGYNMFAACNNNPVMLSDPSGLCPIGFIGPCPGPGKCKNLPFPSMDDSEYIIINDPNVDMTDPDQIIEYVKKTVSIEAGLDLMQKIIDGKSKKAKAFVDTDNILHLAPKGIQTPKYPKVSKTIGVISTGLTLFSLGYDIGMTWNEKNSNTTAQRWEKTGVQVTGAAVGVASGCLGGLCFTAAVNAYNPVGWIAAGAAIVVGAPMLIDMGMNAYYDWRGIQ